jgi:hypothetical protein
VFCRRAALQVFALRFRLLLVVLLIWAATGTVPGQNVPETYAAGTNDQSQTERTWEELRASENLTLAQTFTAGLSGALDHVDLPLRLFGGLNGDPILSYTVQIRDVVGGRPGTTVLASTTISARAGSSAGPTPIEFKTHNFSPPATVTVGTQYAITVATGIPVTWAGVFRNAYSGGRGYQLRAFGEDPYDGYPYDLAFQTFVISTDSTIPSSTSTATPTPTATVTQTPTPAPTATATPMPPLCNPRVWVLTRAAKTGEGQLQYTFSVTSNAGIGVAPNTIKSLTFGQMRNGTVDIEGIGPAQSGQRIGIPFFAQRLVVTVTRVPGTAGQAVHIPLTIEDACQHWQTFIGGGAAGI